MRRRKRHNFTPRECVDNVVTLSAKMNTALNFEEVEDGIRPTSGDAGTLCECGEPVFPPHVVRPKPVKARCTHTHCGHVLPRPSSSASSSSDDEDSGRERALSVPSTPSPSRRISSCCSRTVDAVSTSNLHASVGNNDRSHQHDGPKRHRSEMSLSRRRSRNVASCSRVPRWHLPRSTERFKRRLSSIVPSSILNLFKRPSQPLYQEATTQTDPSVLVCSKSPCTLRALPPLPSEDGDDSHNTDYASSIERVKDCGWYWGPISGEMAEELLVNEPDGSFVVRDSSDQHYIFSLTFKLNGLVRHVRIEHDQGIFSFGSLQRFHSDTIVDFIESAVQHSRSGRYLFFLHSRPVVGPMRVQLLHPLSRFKQVQSLQHLCRFAILKNLRRDLVNQLPLPKQLRDYLNQPNYYTEDLNRLMQGRLERLGFEDGFT